MNETLTKLSSTLESPYTAVVIDNLRKIRDAFMTDRLQASMIGQSPRDANK